MLSSRNTSALVFLATYLSHPFPFQENITVEADQAMGAAVPTAAAVLPKHLAAFFPQRLPEMELVGYHQPGSTPPILTGLSCVLLCPSSIKQQPPPTAVPGPVTAPFSMKTGASQLLKNLCQKAFCPAEAGTLAPRGSVNVVDLAGVLHSLVNDKVVSAKLLAAACDPQQLSAADNTAISKAIVQRFKVLTTLADDMGAVFSL